jgi:hypothetical protein
MFYSITVTKLEFLGRSNDKLRSSTEKLAVSKSGIEKEGNILMREPDLPLQARRVMSQQLPCDEQI